MSVANFSASRRALKGRLLVAFIVVVLLIAYLVFRLAWIQIVQADELYEQAWKQWNHTVPVSTARGAIYDSHDRLLAGNTTAYTVAAIPPQVEDVQNTAAALAPVLEMEAAIIEELVNLDRSAVYLKRKVDTETAETVREMNIPGIVFFNEEKRYYPGGNLAAQLLGFVGMDEGLAGLEAYYENVLRGSEGMLLYPADRKGRMLPQNFNHSVQPEQGLDIYLGIDETIQHIVERELDRIVEEAAPKQAMALAVDPYTGAVLAVAARPDYNPDHFDSYNPESWGLAPFTSSFEPGSTFKMITLAALIEEGQFEPDEHFHCSGSTVVNGYRINCWTADRGGHGDLTFYQSVGASCNPAFIKMISELEKEDFYKYIEAFGFGQPTGIDYPGESPGLVFSPEVMGPLELATTSFGQGISVTPIQQTMAIAAMVNGGYLYRPYLVEKINTQLGEEIYYREPEMVRQVVSRETSALLVELMESVVLDGTGYNVALEGYSVAGKTGTAEKLGPEGSYLSDEFIYSFVGFAPVEEPQLVLYVAVDGVTKGPRLGVHTSAPLFKRIMEDTLTYMQVPPSGPIEQELEEQESE